MPDLLDVSVWVALSAQDHSHHPRAHHYWHQEAVGPIIFCWFTSIQWSQSLDIRTGLWTDAYLAAFASVGKLRLVTFDSDFLKFPDLSLLHLKDQPQQPNSLSSVSTSEDPNETPTVDPIPPENQDAQGLVDS